MGELHHLRSRSRYRRARRLRGDRRGVVAVIGTLLALLVFFALFGVFLTQYVPLWMEEDESQLSSQLQGSLATLKSGVDDQYIIGGIPTYSVPFALGSQSVPLLAQPTVATLSYIAGCPGGFYSTNGTPRQVGGCDFEHIAYTTGKLASGSQNNSYHQISPTDYLQVVVPNRYYSQVEYFFQEDGITEAQTSTHQWMLVPPPLNISRTSGGAVSVTSSLLVLVGPASSYSGQGSKDVTSTFVSTTNVSSAGRFETPKGAPVPFNLTITLGVHDVCAWYNYLYNASLAALGTSGSGVWTLTGAQASGALALPPSSSVCALSLTSSYDLTLELFGVSSAVTFIDQDELSFNAGGL